MIIFFSIDRFLKVIKLNSPDFVQHQKPLNHHTFF